MQSAPTVAHRFPQLGLRTYDRSRQLRNTHRDGYRDAFDSHPPKANTMTPLDFVLAQTTPLQSALDRLPSHSHIAALFSLTLYRLEEEADAIRRVALERAA
jgi:hypothetical protein